MSTASWALVPRDGLFLKDARGWFGSASGRTRSLPWPAPTTIAGALRAACGRLEEAARGAPLAPAEWLERSTALRVGASLPLRRACPDGSWERAWPVPADVVYYEGKPARLEPEPPSVPTLGAESEDAAAREALWRPPMGERAKPTPPPAWWADAALRAWLTGGPLPTDGSEGLSGPARRLQMHLAIHPATQTAAEGKLYSLDVLETLVAGDDAKAYEWAIGAQLEAEQEPALEGVWTPLGGKARLVRFEPVGAETFAAPDVSSAGPWDALRLLVVTPACFSAGWLPDGFEAHGAQYRGSLPTLGLDDELILRAAFVPRPDHVSGWDLANGRARPTERLVRPGAVFVVQRASGAPFHADALTRAWLAPWGARTEDGFGRVVAGGWRFSPSLVQRLARGDA